MTLPALGNQWNQTIDGSLRHCAAAGARGGTDVAPASGLTVLVEDTC